MTLILNIEVILNDKYITTKSSMKMKLELFYDFNMQQIL